MKGILVTTDNVMSVQEYGEPLYQTVGKSVDGYIEIVHPRGLKEPYCMIVNEEGRLQDLPFNAVGSILYGTPQHGEPIVGNMVIMKEGYKDGEPDIVGLEDRDIDYLKTFLKPIHTKEDAE